LAWRSCSRFFTCLCEKILWRACLSSPQEVLALRSWSSYAMVLVWFFWMVKWRSYMKIEGPNTHTHIYIYI
jgi:hypothetical protein